MINNAILQDVLTEYKLRFNDHRWPEEKFKWQAVKCFQDNRDVNSDDFAEMLKASLSETHNLLDSRNNFPRGAINALAENYPEEVRGMFLDLFDEQKDVFERIQNFKQQAARLHEKLNDGGRNHFQSESAISTYLWLRYPDKYYIYRYSIARDVAEYLESDLLIKRGAYAENLRNCYRIFSQINDVVKQDDELRQMLQAKLTPDCYADPELNILALDIAVYISREIVNSVWSPKNYSPGIAVERWIELLKNPEVFTQNSLKVMKRIKHHGGQATCSQLSEKYGNSTNFYNNESVALAMRVFQTTGCPLYEDNNETDRYWPVLFIRKRAAKDIPGAFIWKLRDKLLQALDQIDLSHIELDENGTNGKTPYNKSDFLKEVFMSESRYDALVTVLKKKKNIILQGAPGVGKTFAAKRLAYSVMGVKDEERIDFIQFHQNYSYEDFIMGYKPTGDGFELQKGIFYRFCQKAAKDPDKKYYFIIDEINRGNLSKIFGELLMLIEDSYRGVELTLAYNGQPFSVPRNLHLIGLMNTADRSLAMIDYALRRRFSFFEMEPGFDTEGFQKYQSEIEDELFDDLILRIIDLNNEITLDRSLGKGFCIGHSYFCGLDKPGEEDLRAIVEFDIVPMLSEYWFDDQDKLQRWENILFGLFQ